MDIEAIAATMRTEPWAVHLQKALAIVTGQRIAPLPGSQGYQVQGGHGTYMTTTDRCTCEAAKWRPRAWCSHRTAVELLQRIGRTTMNAESSEKSIATDETPRAEIAGTGCHGYQALGNITRRIAQVGVEKKRSIQGRNGTYRAIDDILNVLSGIMAEEGIMIVPEVLSEQLTEVKRETWTEEKYGKKTEGVTITQQAVVGMEFTFLYTPTGQALLRKRMSGQGVATGGSALQIAQTFAYKQLCVLTFAIPVRGMEGDEDGRIHDEDEKSGTMSSTGVVVAMKKQPAGIRDQITQIMRDMGRDDAAIAEYWTYVEKKYAEDLPRRLPGILREMQEKQSQGKEAVHG